MRTKFEDYKEVHKFMFPEEELKSWITEEMYINLFNSDWNMLMPLVGKCYYIDFEADDVEMSGRSTKSNVRSFTLSVSRLHKRTSWIHCLQGRFTSLVMYACIDTLLCISGLSVTKRLSPERISCYGSG